MASPISAASKADQIFNVIRRQEVRFPFPVQRHTYTVGTFNAATGRFSYSVTTYSELLEEGTKPRRLTGGRIDAVNVSGTSAVQTSDRKFRGGSDWCGHGAELHALLRGEDLQERAAAGDQPAECRGRGFHAAGISGRDHLCAAGG